MVYYKLVQDDKILAVGTTANLRKHQKKHNILIGCSENEAQYIEAANKIYRDKWMRDPVAEDLVVCEEVDIEAVSEEEYQILLEALKTDEEVSVELSVVDPIPKEQLEDEKDYFEEDYTLDYVREVKLKELQLACTKAITDGFEIELSDGKLHRFSLSIQDQMNLNSNYLQILSGAKEVPYHADGEEDILFSSEEMTIVINAANAHKVYHLAYFNSLKKWVNSLRKITTVSAVEYGSEIPKKYQSAFYSSVSG